MAVGKSCTSTPINLYCGTIGESENYDRNVHETKRKNILCRVWWAKGKFLKEKGNIINDLQESYFNGWYCFSG